MFHVLELEQRCVGVKVFRNKDVYELQCVGIERVAVWGSCGGRQLQRVAVAA